MISKAHTVVVVNAQLFSKINLSIVGLITVGRGSLLKRNFLDFPGHRVSPYLQHDIHMQKRLIWQRKLSVITMEYEY